MHWSRNGPRCASAKLKLETDGGQHVFEVQVYLDDLDPEAVQVELYADGADGRPPERVEMKRVRQLVGAATATLITRACLQRVRHRTIRRGSYRSAMTWRFLWKMRISCGSDDRPDGLATPVAVINAKDNGDTSPANPGESERPLNDYASSGIGAD